MPNRIARKTFIQENYNRVKRTRYKSLNKREKNLIVLPQKAIRTQYFLVLSVCIACQKVGSHKVCFIFVSAVFLHWLYYILSFVDSFMDADAMQLETLLYFTSH